MTDELKFHPLAGVYPMIEGEDFDNLVSDISERGLRIPIVLFDDSILDGRNRYLACKAAHVELSVDNFVTYAGDDPVGEMLSLNKHRRHLKESQRAMVAANIANLPAHRPADKSALVPTSSVAPVSQADAAKLLGVSERIVRYAAKVKADGVPELVLAVEKGVVAAHPAADVSKLPREDQAAIVAAGPAAVLKAAKTVRKNSKRKPSAPALESEPKPAGPKSIKQLIAEVDGENRRPPPDVPPGEKRSREYARIDNPIVVPKMAKNETSEQRAIRFFLDFSSDDVEICNKIMRDLGLEVVQNKKRIEELLAATRIVMGAWMTIEGRLVGKLGTL